MPFHIFMKKSIKSTRIKQAINYKQSFPTTINKRFKNRYIDAAFISSIESKRKNIKCLNLGIVAKKEIKSVLLKQGKTLHDSHSASSNALANVLGLKGEVIIGDRALKAYLKNPDIYIDLAKQWHEKYKLPFVFARLCVNKRCKYYKKLSKKFLQKKVKIPNYILKSYATSRDINPNEIQKYLKLVTYHIGYKEEKSLKLFFNLLNTCIQKR